MSNEQIVEGFHSRILAEAVRILGRDLTDKERNFVTCHRGFIALEMILDTVKSGGAMAIERYLNSEP